MVQGYEVGTLFGYCDGIGCPIREVRSVVKYEPEDERRLDLRCPRCGKILSHQQFESRQQEHERLEKRR